MVESNSKVLKIVSVFFVPAKGIQEITENEQNAVLSFYPGNNWEEIKFSTATYFEAPTKTDDGTLYKQSLKLVMAGDDAELQKRLHEIESSKPVFRFDYTNEISKLIGDKQNYCQIIGDFSSEAFVTKREILISRSSDLPAFFLNL